MKQNLQERFQSVAVAELPRLRHFALALTADPHRADDFVQGALERMYVAWPRTHDVGNPGAYLRTILVRLVLNERRRPWRREHSAAVLPDAGYDSTAGTDLSLDLNRALAGLTVKQRAIVVLRYIEDRPVKEVADILGIATGTVKRQSADAVARLRRILGEDFVDDADEPASDQLSPEVTTAEERLPASRLQLDVDDYRRGTR
jgi:RNA polymerase sigma-70 factor (sigma-E family)